MYEADWQEKAEEKSNVEEMEEVKLARDEEAAEDVGTKLGCALFALREPSLICSSIPYDLPLPGLEIDGVGPISLPLTAAQAKQIIGICNRAPYSNDTSSVDDATGPGTWTLDTSLPSYTLHLFRRCEDILCAQASHSR